MKNEGVSLPEFIRNAEINNSPQARENIREIIRACLTRLDEDRAVIHEALRDLPWNSASSYTEMLRNLLPEENQ